VSEAFKRRFALYGAAEGGIVCALWCAAAAAVGTGHRLLAACVALALGALYTGGLMAARNGVAQHLRDPRRVADAALLTSLFAAVLPAIIAALRFGVAGTLWAAGTATATSLAFLGTVSTLAPPDAVAGPGVRKRDLIVGATIALAVAGWASVAALLVGGQQVLGLPHGGTALSRWVPLFGPAFLLFTYAVARSAGRALADDVDRARQAIADMAATGTLERPLQVIAADEIGALTAALAGLRTRLREELATYEQAEQRAHHAEQRKDHFLQLLSHELRAPLSAIADEARALGQGSYGELPRPAQRDDVRIIEGAAHHLLGLLDDVVDMSVLQAGKLKLDMGEVDAASLVRDVVRELGGLVLASRRKLDLVADAPEPIAARADVRRIRQVIVNLVANAIKFTRQGSVRVQARAEAGRVRIRVIDTGEGIATHEQERIFDEYRQVGGKKGGYGLGLAISRRLVELHGGTLTVKSEFGSGSTFTLDLPA
jgi:signal transduction histidine kinase